MTKSRKEEPTRLGRFFTAREASEILGISPGTLRDWARQGRLPHHKIGGPKGKVLFKEEDLIAFMERTRQPSTNEVLGRVWETGLEDPVEE